MICLELFVRNHCNKLWELYYLNDLQRSSFKFRKFHKFRWEPSPGSGDWHLILREEALRGSEVESLEGPSLERCQLLDMAWAWIQKRFHQRFFKVEVLDIRFFPCDCRKKCLKVTNSQRLPRHFRVILTIPWPARPCAEPKSWNCDELFVRKLWGFPSFQIGFAVPKPLDLKSSDLHNKGSGIIKKGKILVP